MSERGTELEKAVQRVLRANATLRRELAEAREENRRLRRTVTADRAVTHGDPERRRRRALQEPWARNP